MSEMNREQWLNKAVDVLRDGLFKEHNVTLPEKLRVSCGFTGSRHGNKAIGVAYHANASRDKVPQVFISPVNDDPVRVLDILVHELIHTAYPEDGHRGNFARVARAVGLEGKLTATVASETLKKTLTAVSETLGAYPHSSIDLTVAVKKQATAMLKVQCLRTEYVVRMTRKWIEEYGTPRCPCCEEKMTEITND